MRQIVLSVKEQILLSPIRIYGPYLTENGKNAYLKGCRREYNLFRVQGQRNKDTFLKGAVQYDNLLHIIILLKNLTLRKRDQIASLCRSCVGEGGEIDDQHFSLRE